MRALALTALLALAACHSASSVLPSEAAGPIVQGKAKGQTNWTGIAFSDDGLGEKSVLATESYVASHGVTFNGGNISKSLGVDVSADWWRLWLAKHMLGSGHKDAPTTRDMKAMYGLVGGREYGLNTYRLLGFGYSDGSSVPPVFFGEQETDTDAATRGDAIIGSRASSSNGPVDVRFRVRSDGQILGEGSYTPTTDQSLATKKYVDAAIAKALAK